MIRPLVCIKSDTRIARKLLYDPNNLHIRYILSIENPMCQYANVKFQSHSETISCAMNANIDVPSLSVIDVVVIV
jgi:hypothetical protein